MHEHEKALSSFNEITNGDIPVIVDFFATWCGPCQMMGPILDDLKKRFGEKLRVIKIDIDNRNNIKVVQQFRVRSVPTLMLFQSGELLWRESGARDANSLEEIIRSHAKQH